MVDETALMNYDDMDLYGEDDALPEEETRVSIPRLYLAQGQSKPVKEGLMPPGNWYVTQDDNVINLGKKVKFAFIPSGMYNNRTMWKFKPDGSKDDSSTSPVCGSNNGISARQNYLPADKPNVFTDWRNGSRVVILPDNCQNCPLSRWTPILDANGEKVLENGKAKNGAPPCQDTPNYLFYIQSEAYSGTVFFQTSNFTVKDCMKGWGKQHKLYKLNGDRGEASMASYYRNKYEQVKDPVSGKYTDFIDPQTGKKVLKELAPAIDPQTGLYRWLVFTPKNFVFSASKSSWGFLKELDAAMTADENEIFRAVIGLFQAQKQEFEESMNRPVQDEVVGEDPLPAAYQAEPGQADEPF